MYCVCCDYSPRRSDSKYFFHVVHSYATDTSTYIRHQTYQQDSSCGRQGGTGCGGTLLTNAIVCNLMSQRSGLSASPMSVFRLTLIGPPLKHVGALRFQHIQRTSVDVFLQRSSRKCTASKNDCVLADDSAKTSTYIKSCGVGV